EMYKTMFPELLKFQEDAGVEKVIEIPAPPMIHGRYISPDERKNLPSPFKAVDNNIIMPDLRTKANGSYRLRDKFVGFDLNHYYLVIEAQAKLHALSWAYKCKTGTDNLTAKYPFLRP
ncbi:unnamed protein product, partial [Allacma fusca]